MDVFVVQHIHEHEDGEEDVKEDVKMIGVYSSQSTAREAVARLSVQPGFCDLPQGFHIDLYPVDQDHWAEGYISLPTPSVTPPIPTATDDMP